jgi:glycosyltransferase involved in cell wall biosynthesis
LVNYMRKRLILSANAIPKQGGQGLNLVHMIEGSRNDFELSVFCRGTYSGVDTQAVPYSSTSRLIGGVRLLRRLRDWQTLFADSNFDSYVAQRLNGARIFQGVTGQCMESLKAAKDKGCRTLLDVVTTHIDDFGAQQDRECAKFQVRPSIHPRQRKRIRLEYERADLIRVMSERAQRTFLERGFSDKQVVVIPPPVNLDEFPEARFAEPKFRVSFVGLIEPWKGFHYLIDAFNALNLPDSELVLWGGSGTRSVSRYLKEQMTCNPAIVLRPVEVRRYGYGQVYGQSSVLVQPSLADGFSYVVAEAMASGIPVIVTNSTGASDVVVDGVNGYIVPPADSDAIRDRLAHLAANPALVREMGRAARDTARSLTFEKFQQRYVSCLNTLAA